MFTGKFNDPNGNFNSFDFESQANVRIAFWGRLYNRNMLGVEQGLTDAQVVATLYSQYGATRLSRLDGSFTFVLVDDYRTMIVRDHHGTGAQVYYNDNYYASSLTLLQLTPDCPTTPDYKQLSRFLSVGYIATPNTAFENISKLAAGSMLLYTNGTIAVCNLFDTSLITPAQGSGDFEVLGREYGQLHEEAIARRIGESRNVGILLSGGYDSGSNLAALRNIYDGEVRSYSIGFKGDEWSELPLARCMSDRFGTIHEQYEIDGTEISALPEIVAALGDPFVEGGLMVNYTAMKMIGAPKPDVILGGDGSDQYFGTSGREIALHYLSAKYGAKPLLKAMCGQLNSYRFDKNTKPYRLRFHLEKVLNILHGDTFGFPQFMLRDLVTDNALLPDAEELRADIRSFEQLYVQHTYKTDIEKVVNQIILFKASRMAELFDNKIAFPYLDTELYKFLLKLPVQYKCRSNSVLDIAKGHVQSKFLLKHHYKPMLPEEITSKKKQGGFAPMPLFFKDAAQRTRIADFVMSSSVVGNFLDRSTVESFVRNYDAEAGKTGNWFWYKQNRAIQYFNLLTLAVWWEKFVSRKSETIIL